MKNAAENENEDAQSNPPAFQQQEISEQKENNSQRILQATYKMKSRKTVRAEILWALNVVYHHYSINSSGKKSVCN